MPSSAPIPSSAPPSSAERSVPPPPGASVPAPASVPSVSAPAPAPVPNSNPNAVPEPTGAITTKKETISIKDNKSEKDQLLEALKQLEGI
jgi:hypothetical protein